MGVNELLYTEKLQWNQIRIVRTREEYHRFSKAAGLPEQYERMEIAGFTWKQGRAAADSAKAIEKSANMMYDLGSTKENVDAWLRDQSIRKKIGSEEYPLLLHKVRQNKHIPGSHEYIQYAANLAKKGQYGPSRLTIGMDTVEQLVQQYHGTGILLKDKNGKWRGIERITIHPSKVGVAVNNITGAEADTTVFAIRYRKMASISYQTIQAERRRRLSNEIFHERVIRFYGIRQTSQGNVHRWQDFFR